MVSISPYGVPLVYSNKHGTNMPYTSTSWYPGYHPNPQYLNGAPPPHMSPMEMEQNNAFYNAHHHMMQQQSLQQQSIQQQMNSESWHQENYGVPTPGSHDFPNHETPPSSAPLPSPHSANPHTPATSIEAMPPTTNMQDVPSPPTTVNSGCSQMSSPDPAHNPSNPDIIPNELSPVGAQNQKSPFGWMKKPSYTSVPNPGKTRTKDKYRVVYTDYQRLELEKEYHTSHYITIRRKAELAVNLHLSERQVKIWFQNRRAKDRKISKKRPDGTHSSPNNGNLPLSMAAVNAMHSMNPMNPMNSMTSMNLPHPSMSGGSATITSMGYGLDIRPKLEPGLMHPSHGFGLSNNPHTQMHHMGMNLLHPNLGRQSIMPPPFQPSSNLS